MTHQPADAKRATPTAADAVPSSEAAGWLAAWSREEPAACPARALDLYRDFTEAFTACFLVPDCPGEGWARRALRSRFGFAPARVVEAILERIRDRRLHLLDAFRRKHLGSLVGPVHYDPRGLYGYLRRVAFVESLKAPAADFFPAEEAGPEIADPLAGEADNDFAHRARLLADFWTHSGRFNRSMQLEGLVSLGLGDFTGEPLLEQRCRDYLTARLPAWEQRWEQTTRRLHQALKSLAEIQARLWTTTGEDRARLEQALEQGREKLRRLRVRMQQHQEALLPPPRRVREILDGFVCPRKLGTVRHERIGREIRILTERVEQRPPAAELAPFAAEVNGHLASRPASPSGHGLSPAQRAGREDGWRAWIDAGAALRRRTWVLADDALEPADELWLGDVRNLYELGIFDRVGVVGGLRWPGWRLADLLRLD